VETGQHTHTLICMHPHCLTPALESERIHNHGLLQVQELELITTTTTTTSDGVDVVDVVDVVAGSSPQALLAVGYN